MDTHAVKDKPGYVDPNVVAGREPEIARRPIVWLLSCFLLFSNVGSCLVLPWLELTSRHRGVGRLPDMSGTRVSLSLKPSRKWLCQSFQRRCPTLVAMEVQGSSRKVPGGPSRP